MTIHDSLSFKLFDRYSVVVPTGLIYEYDDSSDLRALRVTDEKKSFLVTFEEGASMNDMKSDVDGVPCIRLQCCHEDGKYVHMRRRCEGEINEALFHFEIENSEGVIHYLPGQMTASSGYTWSDSIEPPIMAILENINLL